MSLTEKQIYDLNNMNMASQNISLGDVLDNTTSKLPLTGSYVAILGDSENNSSFEEDGTLVFSGSATVWNDIFFPLVTAKQGKTDQPAFSDDEIAYLFPQNDKTHMMYIVAQFPHDMKVGSDLSPHVHWKQTQSGSVVYKMDYKWFPISGSVPSTWETYTMDKHAILYTSGSMHQLNYSQTYLSGSMLQTTGVGVSSIMLIKLYREDNTYTGDAVTYQFDVHYQIDTVGSRGLFTK